MEKYNIALGVIAAAYMAAIGGRIQEANSWNQIKEQATAVYKRSGSAVREYALFDANKDGTFEKIAVRTVMPVPKFGSAVITEEYGIEQPKFERILEEIVDLATKVES